MQWVCVFCALRTAAAEHVVEDVDGRSEGSDVRAHHGLHEAKKNQRREHAGHGCLVAGIQVKRVFAPRSVAMLFGERQALFLV